MTCNQSSKILWRPRISLVSLFLVIALVAIWIRYFQLKNEQALIEREYVGLVDIARELVVSDPTIYAIVHKKSVFDRVETIEVFLPEGRSYNLCLALENIEPDGVADPNLKVPLQAGTYAFELLNENTGDENRISVLANQEKIMSVIRPKDWADINAYGAGLNYKTSQQFPVDEPLIIDRRIFYLPTSPNSWEMPKGPGKGVLLWIE